jgi:hypothetical protein
MQSEMPAEVQIRLYATDGELRAWLADELALMSPTIEVRAVDHVEQLDAVPAALWIVGVEALTLADSELVAELVARRSGPVIAIGAPTSPLRAAAFACVLDARLTSKQLKRAVREALATPSR